MIDPGGVWYVLIEGADDKEGAFSFTFNCELDQKPYKRGRRYRQCWRDIRQNRLRFANVTKADWLFETYGAR